MTELYQTNISLYGRVTDAMKANQGRLPRDFILNGNNCSNGIVISEGCLDKMLFYHRGKADPQPCESILLKASEDPLEACEESERFFLEEPVRYVLVKEDLNAWMQEHHDLIQCENTVSFLEKRIQETVNAEELKFLMDTCGELDAYDESLQRMIRNLSESSEIAAFCYPSLQKFPDGNELIFQIAKNAEGQAKAEAVCALDPDDEEKKWWMIYEGKPQLLGWYSTGAVIAGKCDFESMLEEPGLTIDDRDHIGEITSCFLEEGPAVGLKDLPGWEDICRKYIHMVCENPSTYGIANISHEYECLEQEKDRNIPVIDHLVKVCEDALNDKKIIRYAKERIHQGKDLQLTELLSLPYEEETVFRAFTEDFRNQYRNVLYLKETEHVKKAFQILFDTVDFSDRNETEDSDLVADITYVFEQVMSSETVEENPEKSNEMLAYGLRYKDYGGLYGSTLETIENLQNNGVVMNDQITAYMDEIYRQREEARKKYAFRDQLRMKIREAERKNKEEAKMRN